MELDGMVNEIARDHGRLPFGFNYDRTMTWGMSWRLNETNTFTDFRRSFDRLRQAGVQHRLHGVGEDPPLHLQELVFRSRCKRAEEGEIFFIHEIRRLRKRRHPFAISEPRVPPDMIQM